jgi:hypothetical protein
LYRAKKLVYKRPGRPNSGKDLAAYEAKRHLPNAEFESTLQKPIVVRSGRVKLHPVVRVEIPHSSEIILSKRPLFTWIEFGEPFFCRWICRFGLISPATQCFLDKFALTNFKRLLHEKIFHICNLKLFVFSIVCPGAGQFSPGRRGF